MSGSDTDESFSSEDAQPYLYEPEYSEEELARLQDIAINATPIEVQARVDTNWWCKCGGICPAMSTEMESFCCVEWEIILPSMTGHTTAGHCVTQTEDIAALINPVVLDFVSRCDKVNWKKRPIPSGTNVHLSTKQRRLVAYRVVLEWALKGESLGRGHRTPLPSCVVKTIRQTYPSESGIYVGFQESQEALDML